MLYIMMILLMLKYMEIYITGIQPTINEVSVLKAGTCQLTQSKQH